MSEIVCISPIDGRVVDRRPTASGSAITAALAAAVAAQRDWARVALAERCARALSFLDAMLAMKDAVVPELAWQMGRPVRHGGEFGPFVDRVRYMVAHAEEFLAPTPVLEPTDAIRRFVQRAPVGVVLTIAPWNYPYLTAVNSVVPALIAGNAVILKHAAQTILVGDRFQMAMDAAGVPKGLFQSIALSHDDTARIIGSGAVNLVCFTGSTTAGKVIERAAAGTFAQVGLELGGKDPAYVRADANLEHAIENLVDGAFYNSGQCCCGIERIYVHESLYAPFVEGAAALASRYVLGDPLDPATTLGPMAQARLADIVRGQTAQALSMGARALIDPANFPTDPGRGTYLAPQILVDVDHDMRVMTEESFGPVVGIMKVTDDDMAVRLMNDSAYGLTAAIWTSDVDAAQALGERLETGTVFMNRCDHLDPGLAWTGVKDSGRGVTLSKLGYDALTRPKSFHLRSLA